MAVPSSSAAGRHRRISFAAWLCFLVMMLPLHQAKLYNSRFNKICRYGARNISAALFKNGVDGGFDFLMPLEARMVVTSYATQPWQACFGPGEQPDISLIQSGKKLPCFYSYNEFGNIDYWEENACDILLRSNCYCYAISKYVGSYCEPGLGSTGQAFKLPVKDCYPAVQGVLADGGRLVDRWQVYSQQPGPGSHYIALAVKPADDDGDTGDFHFWRLDDDKTWSYKAGDTLSRNTFRNGTLIRDIEAPEARGHYTQFCGFFQVWPESHKLVGNSYYFSNLPARFKLWRDAALKGQVTTLSAITPAWLAAYKSYYAEAGWEDGIPRPRESARLPMRGAQRRHPHTYSVRPFAS